MTEIADEEEAAKEFLKTLETYDEQTISEINQFLNSLERNRARSRETA